MNVLTKVFVVLMTVLSIVLVSLVVPFVANTENYRDQMKGAEARALAAEANATVAQSVANASRNELNLQLDQRQTELTGARQLNDQLKGQLTSAVGELERIRADFVRTQADIANLTETAKQLTAIQTKQSEELAARRKDTTDQARTILQLEAANNDLASARNTLQRQLRLAQENLIKTQEELTEVMARYEKVPVEHRNGGTAVGPDANDSGEVPPVPILAQVSDVKQAGDTTLVQLNVGSSGGIKPRMKFLVHRDGQYQATVIIMTTDEQVSVGRVKTLRSGGEVKTGDSARAGPVN